MGGGGRNELPENLLPLLALFLGVAEIALIRGGGGRPPKDFKGLVPEEDDAVAGFAVGGTTEMDVSPPTILLLAVPLIDDCCCTAVVVARTVDTSVFPKEEAAAATGVGQMEGSDDARGQEITPWAFGVEEGKAIPPLGGEENTSWADEMGVSTGAVAATVEDEMPPLGGEENISLADDIMGVVASERGGTAFVPLGLAPTGVSCGCCCIIVGPVAAMDDKVAGGFAAVV
mmetsp:Transcript_38066/g.79764  ORF Transcript_38066/g.79764 Transcript_38066/m.79764 type:complete len:230 (+) Transcript_38066:317-1006(+)